MLSNGMIYIHFFSSIKFSAGDHLSLRDDKSCWRKEVEFLPCITEILFGISQLHDLLLFLLSIDLTLYKVALTINNKFSPLIAFYKNP